MLSLILGPTLGATAADHQQKVTKTEKGEKPPDLCFSIRQLHAVQ